MTKKIIFILSFLLLFPLIALAADWTEIKKSNAGDVFYLDKSSIKVDNNKSSFWYETQFKSGTYSTSYVTVDCNERTYSMLETHLYGASGKIIKEDEKSSSSFEPIPPDATIESMYSAVCNQNNSQIIDVNDLPSTNLYKIYLERKIYSNISFPLNHEQNSVSLKITISKDGKLTDITVINSTGNVDFNNFVINAAHNSSPFRPIPKSAKAEQLDFLIDIKDF